MRMEPKIASRIVKNALLSLLIYVLPILLMFLTFYFNGQQPWKKKTKQEVKTTVNNKNSKV